MAKSFLKNIFAFFLIAIKDNVGRLVLYIYEHLTKCRGQARKRREIYFVPWSKVNSCERRVKKQEPKKKYIQTHSHTSRGIASERLTWHFSFKFDNEKDLAETLSRLGSIEQLGWQTRKCTHKKNVNSLNQQSTLVSLQSAFYSISFDHFSIGRMKRRGV